MDEIELYRQMLTKDPSSQAFVYLAEAYLERGMHEEAIDTCVNGLRLRPHDLRARVILGLSFFRTGELERAEAELLKAKEMLEINAVAYEALAEIYDGKGEFEQAGRYREIFRAFYPKEVAGSEAEISPTEAVSEDVLSEDAEVATVTMAELYVRQGHPEKAAAIYRKILETAPDTVGVEDRLKKLERELGRSEKDRSLLAVLEAWRSDLQEKTAGRTEKTPLEPGAVDIERFTDFVRKYFRDPDSS
jgi:tetratricopeptide (TPR) repeat protein